MGWFFRKSFRLLPGVRLSVSKSGPRLSVGFLGARASVGLDGKVRIFGGKGPLRYQKQISLSPKPSRGTDSSAPG
jgi:hypothetical protein